MQSKRKLFNFSHIIQCFIQQAFIEHPLSARSWRRGGGQYRTPAFVELMVQQQLGLYYRGLWISHWPLLPGLQTPLHFHTLFQEQQSPGRQCCPVTWHLILNTQELLAQIFLQLPPSQSLPLLTVSCRAAECWSFTPWEGQGGLFYLSATNLELYNLLNKHLETRPLAVSKDV